MPCRFIPLKREADYQATLAEIDALFAAEHDTPEGDRLDVLTILVAAYAAQQHPVPLPDPIEAILYHLESRGLSRRDLEPYIGSRARVSAILNCKRPLTLDMICKLHHGLDIPVEVLIQPYPTARQAAT